ncbi:MAG: capsular polysaccharide biosynthesis protein, partial [Desulfovibrio sp.]|nr:capsular polysaccharide biosynthesis protein [Desulfovibrio sp.]
SELENLLSSSWEASPALLNEAKKAIELLIAWDLSKYNHSPKITAAELGEKSGKRILVLDQTKGDVSVALGLANEATFTTMLQAALNEHPSALILVKVHPDVLSGRKKGYFKPSHLPSNVRLLSTDCSPLSLLALVDEVYTVTSQMGFEALFLGKKVHCFGLPFYAGWGLTCDRLTSQRRGKKRSLQEVFAASYLLYAKYLDLASGKLVNFFQVTSLLRLERQINEENRGFRACLGFSAWKHEHASAFLASTQGTVKFYEDEDKALRDCCEFKGKLVVWSSKESPNLAKKACDLGVEVLRMEDGFIRSIGLGSNYHLPGSLVLDDLGIYYDPIRESRLERLLNSPISPELICEAKQISELLVQQGISKYNMQGGNDLPILPTDRKIILVPGQVEDDASVRLGGQGIFSNTALLEAVRKAEPTSYILYKEHPDVVSGNRLGKVQPEALSRLADGVVRSTPIEVVLPLCQEVHTLTSLTGFEALLRGLTVVTYGGPFYAGWGLTRDRLSFPRRKRRLQLFELVAATLLLYPRYYDWEHKCFISCASFVEWLAKRRSSV